MPAPVRPARRPLQTEVVAIERLTSRLYRMIVTGDDLADLAIGEHTDHYVKVMFPGPGADYAAPFDPEQIKATRPKEHWPRTRSYTVRAWDPATRRLTLDFVYHGDLGVGGPWVATARPGDTLQLLGPGGGYSPDPDADWHMLIGDECVLPAIAVALERVPANERVIAVIEVHGPDDELPLPTAADAQIVWVHRTSGDDDRLLRAVERLDLPDGHPHLFLHGEATAVRAIRKHLLGERGVPGEGQSISGYWKRRRTDEGWRAEKAEWKAAIAADLPEARPASRS